MPRNANQFYFPHHLKKELERLTEYPLTLVEAGSGFGKTTAIGAKLRRLSGEGYRHFWYTCLGEPPEKVWENLCALLARVDPRTAGYLAKFTLPTLSVIGDIPRLLETVRCEQETVLVIDNYQLAGLPEPLRLLEALSLHGCEPLHIVVITQPVQTLGFATAQFPSMYKIGQGAFYFSPEDIAAYAKKTGVSPSQEQAEQIFRSTEGWIAAVSLWVRQLKESGTLQGPAGFSSLMDAALWNRLTETERILFLRLSVLSSFSPKLAAAVLGQAALTEGQRALLRNTVFIRWNEDAATYTFHSLLNTYLECRLRDMPDSFRRETIAHAAEACAACGDHVQAACFYAEIGEWEKLLALPYRDYELTDLGRYSDGRMLEEIFRACSPALMMQYPDTTLLFTLETFLEGQHRLFGEMYGLLEAMCATPGLYPEAETRRVEGQVEIIRAFVAFNDVAAMSCHHERAWELLDHRPIELYSLHTSWTFGAPSVVALFWRESGGLAEAYRQVERGMPCYYRLTRGHGTGAETAMQAEMLLLQGDDASAEALCYKAYYEAGGAQQDSIAFCADLVMGRIMLLRGDAPGYQNVLEGLQRRAFEGSVQDSVTTSELCRAFLDNTLGRRQEIPAWLQDSKALREQVYEVPVPFCGIVYLRIVLERNRKEFEGMVSAFLAETEAMHMALPRLYFLLYLAVEKERQNQRDEALAYFGRALELALPDRVYLPFAELYKELEPLIQTEKRRGSQPEALEIILELGRRLCAGTASVCRTLYPAETELTPREREIALLVKQRMSAKEIAAHLYISESTVKNTMQKIYSKLDVHNKTELAAKHF
jgi:LuxR family maltose regulon positive regulatory protein